jgi:hypothetical protein
MTRIVCLALGLGSKKEKRTMQNEALSPELLKRMDAYWRAANYLSVGQIYIYDNPLLRAPLHLSHVKPTLLGHLLRQNGATGAGGTLCQPLSKSCSENRPPAPEQIDSGRSVLPGQCRNQGHHLKRRTRLAGGKQRYH